MSQAREGMGKIFVTLPSGEEQVIAATIGVSLMENIRDNGIEEIVAMCGGSCSCGTCHVHVDPEYQAHLPPMDVDEDDLLDGNEGRNEHSRLSCQIKFTEEMDGIKLVIVGDN